MVSPDILGRPLAEPWRRLVGILVDLVVVAGLSMLSRPVLGLATGIMLLVLLGNSNQSPLLVSALRWGARLLGLTLIVLSGLALGDAPWFRASAVHLEAFTGREATAAMKKSIYVRPDASQRETRAAVDELQGQVDDLKREIREQESRGASLTNELRAFSRALGITFGWSGIYFTLIAGLWNGRTLGKWLFRTRALRVNGARMTFFDAFIRHGGYIAGLAMGLLGFLKLLWEPNRQAVEDRIAGTVVVRA